MFFACLVSRTIVGIGVEYVNSLLTLYDMRFRNLGVHTRSGLKPGASELDLVGVVRYTHM